MAHIISVIDVTSGLVVARVAPTLRTDQGYGPTFSYALAVDTLRNRLLVNNTFFALDQLRATGRYTNSGTPVGESSWLRYWFASALLPRYYAITASGLKISQMLIAYVSESLKPQYSDIANVAALALDDGAQRHCAASTLAVSITTTENALHVLDASTLNPIAQLSMPSRVTAMALDTKTHYLFLAYHGDVVHPSADDDSVEILETNGLGRVGTFRVAAEPSAMAVLGDNPYIASSTAADLTIVRDCLLDASPSPATSTPLPTPSPAPTTTPFPTLTSAPPTPVKPITGWMTHTNSTLGYRISYPNTWHLSADDPANTVFVTSFEMQSSGPGGIPPGSVKIDTASAQKRGRSTYPPLAV